MCTNLPKNTEFVFHLMSAMTLWLLRDFYPSGTTIKNIYLISNLVWAYYNTVGVITCFKFSKLWCIIAHISPVKLVPFHSHPYAIPANKITDSFMTHANLPRRLFHNDFSDSTQHTSPFFLSHALRVNMTYVLRLPDNVS